MTPETANYDCPDCGGVLEDAGGDEYECRRCGQRVTEYEALTEAAETVRSEGFDELADRLEAAAEEAENGA